MNESDALIFHTFNHHKDTGGDNHLPLPRAPFLQNQIWVFYQMESPGVWTMQFDMQEYNGAFNWTMTYRRDSDVPWEYGRFVRRKRREPHGIPKLSSIIGKQLVAVMISKCQKTVSGRKSYIRKLRKYLQVDYYGRCGNLTCPLDENCYETLSKRYKFWLAFENSLCLDYVTGEDHMD